MTLDKMIEWRSALKLLEASVKYWMFKAVVIVSDELLLSSVECSWMLSLKKNPIEQTINIKQWASFLTFLINYSRRLDHSPSEGNEVYLNQNQCHLLYNGLDTEICSEWSHR